MKILPKILGLLVVCIFLLVIVLRVTGLEPKDRRPGLWLKGQLITTPVTDWSFIKDFQTDRIQTRTWYLIPHSVNTNYILYNDQLFVTSAFPAGRPFPQGKSWTANVARDPRVRIGFGEQLFDRKLALVTDEAERKVVLESRGGAQTSSNGSTTYLFRVLPE